MKIITKIIILSTGLIVNALSSVGQDWSVNPSNFEHTMNIIGQISNSGDIVNQQNSQIGAFVNDKCVGVTAPIKIDEEFKYFYLTVYSNETTGETVDFKFIDESGLEHFIDNKIIFNIDERLGTHEKPFIWIISVDNIVGVGEFWDSEEFKIYPNPARDFVNIELPNIENAYGTIFSLSGEVIMKFEVRNRLSISNLNYGLYIIQITTNGGVFNSRLIIKK